MRTIFKGRVVFALKTKGKALVTHQGFNTLASFYESLVNKSKRAVCSDQDNPDLYKKNLTNKIICLPKSIGSTSAGATWEAVAERKIAPMALLFSEQIDSLAAGGIILAALWIGRPIVAVDQLGPEFLASVRDGQEIEIDENGTVAVLELGPRT